MVQTWRPTGMEGKGKNFSLHFAVPPYGPSWCCRAELTRKRRIGPGPGGEGGGIQHRVVRRFAL